VLFNYCLVPIIKQE